MFINLTGDYNLYVVVNNVRFALHLLIYHCFYALYNKDFYTVFIITTGVYNHL